MGCRQSQERRPPFQTKDGEFYIPYDPAILKNHQNVISAKMGQAIKPPTEPATATQFRTAPNLQTKNLTTENIKKSRKGGSRSPTDTQASGSRSVRSDNPSYKNQNAYGLSRSASRVSLSSSGKGSMNSSSQHRNPKGQHNGYMYSDRRAHGEPQRSPSFPLPPRRYTAPFPSASPNSRNAISHSRSASTHGENDPQHTTNAATLLTRTTTSAAAANGKFNNRTSESLGGGGGDNNKLSRSPTVIRVVLDDGDDNFYEKIRSQSAHALSREIASNASPFASPITSPRPHSNKNGRPSQSQRTLHFSLSPPTQPESPSHPFIRGEAGSSISSDNNNNNSNSNNNEDTENEEEPSLSPARPLGDQSSASYSRYSAAHPQPLSRSALSAAEAVSMLDKNILLEALAQHNERMREKLGAEAKNPINMFISKKTTAGETQYGYDQPQPQKRPTPPTEILDKVRHFTTTASAKTQSRFPTARAKKQQVSPSVAVETFSPSPLAQVKPFPRTAPLSADLSTHYNDKISSSSPHNNNNNNNNSNKNKSACTSAPNVSDSGSGKGDDNQVCSTASSQSGSQRSSVITTRSEGGRSYISANVGKVLKSKRRSMMKDKGW